MRICCLLLLNTILVVKRYRNHAKSDMHYTVHYMQRSFEWQVSGFKSQFCGSGLIFLRFQFQIISVHIFLFCEKNALLM